MTTGARVSATDSDSPRHSGPLVVSQNRRRRSGSVSTTNAKPWLNPADGMRLALATRRSTSGRATGSSEKSRTIRRRCTTSWSSIVRTVTGPAARRTRRTQGSWGTGGRAATARIPASVPIRVTENGWPTGTNPLTGVERSYGRQAEVLDTLVRPVDRATAELNVTHYTLFGLRDADSGPPDLFHQFGIRRDDYAPKPAYATFKSLIRELGHPP